MCAAAMVKLGIGPLLACIASSTPDASARTWAQRIQVNTHVSCSLSFMVSWLAIVPLGSICQRLPPGAALSRGVYASNGTLAPRVIGV